MVVQNMLDRVPPGLHQEVVNKRGFGCSATADSRWGDASSEAVALPRLQPTKGHSTQELPLLVREGAGSALNTRSTTILVWPDLLTTPTSPQALSTPLRLDVSCRPLSSVWLDGSHATLLLWEEVHHSPLY